MIGLQRILGALMVVGATLEGPIAGLWHASNWPEATYMLVLGIWLIESE